MCLHVCVSVCMGAHICMRHTCASVFVQYELRKQRQAQEREEAVEVSASWDFHTFAAFIFRTPSSLFLVRRCKSAGP